MLISSAHGYPHFRRRRIRHDASVNSVPEISSEYCAKLLTLERSGQFEISGGGCILRLVRQEVIAVILLKEMLRSQWRHGMSFEATGKLRDDLDAVLRQDRVRATHPHAGLLNVLGGYLGEGAELTSTFGHALSLLRFRTAEAESNKTLKEVGPASLAASLFGHQRHREFPCGRPNSDSQSLPLA
jgi:hypothetical protein